MQGVTAASIAPSKLLHCTFRGTAVAPAHTRPVCAHVADNVPVAHCSARLDALQNYSMQVSAARAAKLAAAARVRTRI